jgi:hypothetical protein
MMGINPEASGGQFIGDDVDNYGHAPAGASSNKFKG